MCCFSNCQAVENLRYSFLSTVKLKEEIVGKAKARMNTVIHANSHGPQRYVSVGNVPHIFLLGMGWSKEILKAESLSGCLCHYLLHQRYLEVKTWSRSSVFPCECLFVSALTAEPFALASRNLVQGLTLMISWTSVMVEVKVTGPKAWFPGFCYLSEQMPNPGLWYDFVTSYDIMAWPCHVTSQNDVTASRPREVQQHFSVFFQWNQM